MDTILCKDKRDAKETIDAIGIEYILDWEYLPSGEIKIFVDEKFKEDV